MFRVALLSGPVRSRAGIGAMPRVPNRRAGVNIRRAARGGACALVYLCFQIPRQTVYWHQKLYPCWFDRQFGVRNGRSRCM